MKRLWISFLPVLWLAMNACGQSFFFSNAGLNTLTVAPVYCPEPDAPQEQKWGNTADAYPPGTQTYTGAMLGGTNYSVQAWYSLSPVLDVFSLNQDALPLSLSLTCFEQPEPGLYWNGLEQVIPTGNPGAYLQVRVWDNEGGQLNSWDEAWAAALAGGGNAVGWSKTFWQRLAAGPEPPAGMDNFESFNIFIVPEPSTLSLLGLSGLVWLLIRRQK